MRRPRSRACLPGECPMIASARRPAWRRHSIRPTSSRSSFALEAAGPRRKVLRPHRHVATIVSVRSGFRDTLRGFGSGHTSMWPLKAGRAAAVDVDRHGSGLHDNVATAVSFGASSSAIGRRRRPGLAGDVPARGLVDRRYCDTVSLCYLAGQSMFAPSDRRDRARCGELIRSIRYR